MADAAPPQGERLARASAGQVGDGDEHGGEQVLQQGLGLEEGDRPVPPRLAVQLTGDARAQVGVIRDGKPGVADHRLDGPAFEPVGGAVEDPPQVLVVEDRAVWAGLARQRRSGRLQSFEQIGYFLLKTSAGRSISVPWPPSRAEKLREASSAYSSRTAMRSSPKSSVKRSDHGSSRSITSALM